MITTRFTDDEVAIRPHRVEYDDNYGPEYWMCASPEDAMKLARMHEKVRSENQAKADRIFGRGANPITRRPVSARLA